MYQGLSPQLRICFIFTVSLILQACENGGPAGSPPKSSNLISGVFVDSPVHGLSYRTSSGIEGFTDETGAFNFISGDRINFKIGTLSFGETQAKPAITPLDLFHTEDILNARVINFSRLVQTLDDDGDISHVIRISEEHHQLVSGSGITTTELELNPLAFSVLPSVRKIIDAVVGVDSLVSASSAIAHLDVTLSNSQDVDHDGDGKANASDGDDDDDGIVDEADAFPWDSSESQDFDGDGRGDSADQDDDNDGIEDSIDPFPFTPLQSSDHDSDGDGLLDDVDPDDDNDGVVDSEDDLPLNANESEDFDRDGRGDNSDNDDDNDGVSDNFDRFPRDPSEAHDFDGDGRGDNADDDDDGDGISDEEDSLIQMTIPLSGMESLTDSVYFGDHLYVTNKQSRSLSVFNIVTGQRVMLHLFDRLPERMTLSPNGEQLFVALLDREHDRYWKEDEQSAAIAVVDTLDHLIKRTFLIDTDPYDLAVNGAHQLLVSSGSGQHAALAAYDTGTGALIGKGSVSVPTNISLDISGKQVFTTDDSWTSADINRFDINEASVTENYGSFFPGGHRTYGRVWPTPDGKYIITGGAGVFRSHDFAHIKILDIGINDVQIEKLTFDTEAGIAILLLSDKTIKTLNLNSLEFISTADNSIQMSDVYVEAKTALYLVESFGQYKLIRTPHPCLRCDINTPPTALFSYSPYQGDTTTIYNFDASASDDAEDAKALMYRWDIDGDGVWDGEFGASSSVQHQFILSGTKRVTLQVKDRNGLTSTVEKSFSVSQGVSLGASAISKPNVLDYEVDEALIDSAHKRVYIIDKAAQRLNVLDMKTGQTQRYFDLSAPPQSMAITPDNSILYIAMKAYQGVVWSRTDEQYGYVAVFDLDSMAHLQTFKVASDPYDMVVNDSNKLVISSSSANFDSIRAFDGNTGALLGEGSLNEDALLRISPSGETVYAEFGYGHTDIYTFDISGDGIAAEIDEPFLENLVGGGFWITPNGIHMITRRGYLLLASDLSFVRHLDLGYDNPYIENIYFEEDAGVAHFSLHHHRFSGVASENVALVNLTSLEIVSTGPLNDGIEAAYSYGGNMNYIIQSDDNFQVIVTDHPCPDCQNNTAPVAIFNHFPLQIKTTDAVEYNAAGSYDNEGSDLQYRWDTDGDGVWDSAFGEEEKTTAHYTVPGLVEVKLQVRDSYGSTHTQAQMITVSQGINSGISVNDSHPFILSYDDSNAVTLEGEAVSHGYQSTDIALDASRQRLYITDRYGGRLYVVDSNTGLTERYFEFNDSPERMSLSPDGETLYLTLLADDPFVDELGDYMRGYIATIDLNQLAHVRTFEIAHETGDLVATSSGKLIVSGRNRGINVYAANNGELLSSDSLWVSTRLALHPIVDWVFASRSDEYVSSAGEPPIKFGFTGDNIVRVDEAKDRNGQRRGGEIWATPDGQHLINSGGDIFLTTDLRYVASLTPEDVSIVDLAFDAAQQSIVIVGSDNIVYRYDSLTWDQTGSDESHTRPSHLAVMLSGLYVIDVGLLPYRLSPIIF